MIRPRHTPHRPWTVDVARARKQKTAAARATPVRERRRQRSKTRAGLTRWLRSANDASPWRTSRGRRDARAQPRGASGGPALRVRCATSTTIRRSVCRH
jgi:hypothetical protein